MQFINKTQLVVMQATSFCNINCRYCYLPDRSINAVMKDDVLELAIQKLLDSNLLAQEVVFLWHAGEPLSVGIDFYKNALNLMHKHNTRGRTIKNSIQTNGTLINNAWCDFFEKNNFKVSVSLDGPAFLHDKNRVGWNNKGTFDRVMRGVDCIRKHNIPLTAICVVTDRTMDYPNELLEFFLNEGFTRLGLIIEDVLGENTKSSLSDVDNDLSLIKARYQKFISLLFNAWLPYKNKIYIRELVEAGLAISKLSIDPDFVYSSQEMDALNILTIQSNGNISTYCPELAGGVSDNRNKFVIGNVLEIKKLDDIVVNENFLNIKKEVDIGIENCKKQCNYFRLCGGKNPSHKIYETGSFRTTETNHCKLQVKGLIDVLLNELKSYSSAIV